MYPRSVMIINNSGKARMIKFYEQFSDAVQQAIVRETFSLLAKRSDNVCNFLEGGSVVALGKDTRLVYRHYATLFFIFAVDDSESELGILDLIQVFVEVLDKCFENVCELDLIFNCDKVHYILDEIVMGGMVLETNVGEILEGIVEMQRLEQATRALGVKA
jgi:AP-3 complex subunit sigma